MIHNRRLNILTIIPARGGSKGIPKKNIINLFNKPLIAYSIESALKSQHINRVVVSTDSEEIADVSMQYGAEVPFLRPAIISGSKAKVGDTIEYTLSRLKTEEGYTPDILVEMYPTHPFRTQIMIDTLLEKCIHSFTHVITVKPVHIWNNIVFNVDNKTQTLFNSIFFSHSKLYRQYGLFHAYSFHSRPNHTYCHEVTNPIQLIDIDDYKDLELAESVLANNCFSF